MLYDASITEEIALIEPHFDADALAGICALPEEEFGNAFGLDRWNIDSRKDDNFFFFRDNGASVLAVAHLDTVANADTRRARFVDTEGGLVVHSRALDDRLGAYVILDLLPRLGINVDLLLTTGEESGQSTAEFYNPSDVGKEHNWMIEFDRGGTDVVMYQYEDMETSALVRASGARTGSGSFSDIAYLEHLEIKGFNWGVGYKDYHGPRAHAYIDDTLKMVAHFVRFFEDNEDEYLPHEKKRWSRFGSRRGKDSDPWEGYYHGYYGAAGSPPKLDEADDFPWVADVAKGVEKGVIKGVDKDEPDAPSNLLDLSREGLFG